MLIFVKGMLLMLGAQSAPCGKGGDGSYCPFSFDLYGYFIDGKVKNVVIIVQDLSIYLS